MNKKLAVLILILILLLSTAPPSGGNTFTDWLEQREENNKFLNWLAGLEDNDTVVSTEQEQIMAATEGAEVDPWYDSSWDYRKKINITGQSGAGTHYQVKFSIGNDSSTVGEDFDLEGHCNESFWDIRFTDDEVTSLPYWIESVTDSGTGKLAEVWVNVSDNLNSSVDIYVYYGNPSASSASNIDTTFLFSDDFEDGDTSDAGDFFVTPSNLGSSEQAKSGTYSLKHDISNFIYSESMGSKALNSVKTAFYFYPLVVGTDAVPLYRIGLIDSSATQGMYLSIGTNGNVLCWSGSVWVDSGLDVTLNTWNFIEILQDETTFDLTVNTNTVSDLSNAYTITNINKWKLYGNAAEASAFYLDDSFVRKYIATEPAFDSAGGEETPPTPTLEIGNAIAITNDWGQSNNSNISITVSGATAADVNVTYNDTRISNATDWGSKAVGTYWHNQTIQHGGTVGDVYVEVQANTTTLGGANDTEYFWLNTTKRTNTASMDSAATQTAYETEDFFVNATCNEEYGDTFLGAADLLEDGIIISTDASVMDYVNFTWNESSAGVYNYSVRFYNTSFYDNCSTPTYSNVTVSVGIYIPPDPTNLQNTTGYHWVNFTWDEGVGGNITDSYNISINTTWYNGTTDTFIDKTIVAGGWANITVWAFNSTVGGTLSSNNLTDQVQIPEAVVITLVSQTPSLLYQNSTGAFNVTWRIRHGAVGLNNTSISFIYSNKGIEDGSYNHSIRPPANNRAEGFWRADNRNNTLNFEDNATITEGDVYKWGGGDENVTRLTIQVINGTCTEVQWNGTMQDTVTWQMHYLDRTDMQQAAKTTYGVYKKHGLITKIWDIETIEGHEDYIANLWVDTGLGAILPKKPVNTWYCNSSYDVAGTVDPEDSTYCAFVTSHNATTWVDYEYSPYNSTYINAFYVNESAIESTGIVVTNTGWIYFESNEASSKPYNINITNAASTTNVTFAQTGVLHVGSGAPFTATAYTPNIFIEFKHRDHQYQMKLFAADVNGNWGNSSLESTNIGVVDFPPTTPSIRYFYYNDAEDIDMDDYYGGTFNIGCGVATDPDGGVVTHNLTLHYGNGTYNATINNTFTDADATSGSGIINISFNSTAYESNTTNYTLKLKAIDDEANTAERWLGVNFTLDSTAPTISDVARTPASVLVGDPVTISCKVTDANSGVQNVLVRIQDAKSRRYNYSMVHGTGSNYSYEYGYTGASGTYLIKYFYAYDNASNLRTESSDLSFSAIGYAGGPAPPGPTPAPTPTPTVSPSPTLIPAPPPDGLVKVEVWGYETDVTWLVDLIEEWWMEAFVGMTACGFGAIIIYVRRMKRKNDGEDMG